MLGPPPLTKTVDVDVSENGVYRLYTTFLKTGNGETYVKQIRSNLGGCSSCKWFSNILRYQTHVVYHVVWKLNS